jgi:hypothetical protein
MRGRVCHQASACFQADKPLHPNFHHAHQVEDASCAPPHRVAVPGLCNIEVGGWKSDGYPRSKKHILLVKLCLALRHVKEHADFHLAPDCIV